MHLKVPDGIKRRCRGNPEATAWLERLPSTVGMLAERWGITVGHPFDDEGGTCSWVAPAALADGTKAVLKLGMPHPEGLHELQGLRFWAGDPTVQLLRSDVALNAMLLERCEPGTSLRSSPEPEQDVVLAGLLRRLRRSPSAPHPFRRLEVMLNDWAEEAHSASARWPDPALVHAGLELFDELARTASEQVLLATDLHAGNVLRARRKPWLMIDPKPFVGDPAYDASQHLLNCIDRVSRSPAETIDRFADLLELDAERVWLWTFARAAAAPWDDWEGTAWVHYARAIAP